jgi:RNA ligase (TIGR02306 family)
MSELKVPVVKIETVVNHPNADRLDLVIIAGWQCVAARDQFKVGDPAIYIPIDSVLSESLEAHLFANSKIKLNGRRVKTIKIRSAISQGMLVKPETLPNVYLLNGLPQEGDDVGELLGITKYEPPDVGGPAISLGPGKAKIKKRDNPNFPKFTDLQNIKWYPDLFQEGEPIVITEKIHGTNFRAGHTKYNADSWWKKALQFVGLAPKYEFCWGSRKVQLQSKGYKGWYAQEDSAGNVYREAVVKYDIQKRLHPGEIVFGEVYGSKIQKGYTYGCGIGERGLVIFDVMIDGEWLDPRAVQMFCNARGLLAVPVLYDGPYCKEVVEKTTSGMSVLDPRQKVREGCVVRSLLEANVEYFGRKMLKSISSEYLLGDQTDFH